MMEQKEEIERIMGSIRSEQQGLEQQMKIQKQKMDEANRLVDRQEMTKWEDIEIDRLKRFKDSLKMDGVVGWVGDIYQVDRQQLMVSQYMKQYDDILIVDNTNIIKEVQKIGLQNGVKVQIIVMDSSDKMYQCCEVGMMMVDVIQYDSKYRQLMSMLLDRVVYVDDCMKVEVDDGWVLVDGLGLIVQGARVVRASQCQSFRLDSDGSLAVNYLQQQIQKCQDSFNITNKQYLVNECHMEQLLTQLAKLQGSIISKQHLIDNNGGGDNSDDGSGDKNVEVEVKIENDNNIVGWFDKIENRQILNEMIEWMKMGIEGREKMKRQMEKEYQTNRKESEQNQQQINQMQIDIDQVDKQIQQLDQHISDTIQNIDNHNRQIQSYNTNHSNDPSLQQIDTHDYTIQLDKLKHQISNKLQEKGRQYNIITKMKQDNHMNNLNNPVDSDLDDDELADDDGLQQLDVDKQQMIAKITDQIKQNEQQKEEIERELQKSSSGMGEGNIDYKQYEINRIQQQFEQIQQDIEQLKQNQDQNRVQINEVKQKRLDKFNTVFKKVNDTIDKIYKELCEDESANAQLWLENKEEPYKGGLIYQTTPGDKRWVYEIGQLSGGEKTMSQMALVMAVCKAIGTQILVLDEVDCHLDQNNTQALIKFIKTHGNCMQVIVVSHKPTIYSQCQSLIGVTLQNEHSVTFSIKL